MKKWLKIIGIIIVIAAIGSIMFGSDDDKGKSSVPKTEEKEVEEKRYGIGDTMVVGDVEYTVNSVKSSKTIGDKYFNIKAQETFLIINITLKNNENEPLTVSNSFFQLKKGDKTYDTDDDGAIYLDDNIIFDEINPDAKLTGNICFDVTQETIDDKELQLQVQTGSWGTKKGLINLH